MRAFWTCINSYAHKILKDLYIISIVSKVCYNTHYFAIVLVPFMSRFYSYFESNKSRQKLTIERWKLIRVTLLIHFEYHSHPSNGKHSPDNLLFYNYDSVSTIMNELR
jgi:hypothetical protein